MKHVKFPHNGTRLLIRHVPADSRVFAVIDTRRRYHQLRENEESQERLTIVTNMGWFAFKSLPQGMSNAASLWNILTYGDARIDTDLNLIKNMDDWMLHARYLVELEQK